MTGKRRRGNAAPVGDLAVGILDPVLRKRAGITIGLLQSWEEIVGPRMAETTRPQKIVWPRRAHEEEPFEPGTLVIACEGMAALHLQHESGEVIARVNGFLGFAAIGRLKIVQKPVAPPQKARPLMRDLSREEVTKLDRLVSDIEDEGLRQSLAQLGRSVLGERKAG